VKIHSSDDGHRGSCEEMGDESRHEGSLSCTGAGRIHSIFKPLTLENSRTFPYETMLDLKNPFFSINLQALFLWR